VAAATIILLSLAGIAINQSVTGQPTAPTAAAAVAAAAAAMVLPQAITGPGPRLIQEGDLVVVYESYNAIKAVYVDKKGQYANRFGNFQHKVRHVGSLVSSSSSSTCASQHKAVRFRVCMAAEPPAAGAIAAPLEQQCQQTRCSALSIPEAAGLIHQQGLGAHQFLWHVAVCVIPQLCLLCTTYKLSAIQQ
jgi:hypothetical protein